VRSLELQVKQKGQELAKLKKQKLEDQPKTTAAPKTTEIDEKTPYDKFRW
jgi:hypothetical protein